MLEKVSRLKCAKKVNWCLMKYPVRTCDCNHGHGPNTLTPLMGHCRKYTWSTINVRKYTFANVPTVRCGQFSGRQVGVFQQCRPISRFHTAPPYNTEWNISDPYANPVKELEPLLLMPLLSKEEQSFSPSVDDIKTAEAVFTSKPGHPISKVAGLVNLEKLPKDSVPEVAFLGRSNVGKSSLIKAIFHQVPAAKAPQISVSKKPGHTKSLQFFQVGRAFTLVDMPGYGENMPPYYVQSVEKYLSTRKKLCRSFLLLDAETGITAVDKIAIQMMEEFGKPYVMVLTKIDKASQHTVLKNLLKLQMVKNMETHVCFPQPFLVSAMTGAGIKYVQAFISYVTGASSFQGL